MTISFALLTVFVSICCARCKAESICDLDINLTYLDGAVQILAKTKYDFGGKPKDCSELLLLGHHKNGVYKIWPASRLFEDKSLDVYCDMDTSGGGWTVIQRRKNVGSPKAYFKQDWMSYKKGFGDILEDFWLGNDNIFALTNQKPYSARFDLRDMEGNTRYAQYDVFWIDDENHKYMLHIANYTGDAGDSMITHHNNQKFSTKDQKNDNNPGENCAELYKGGWWYYGIPCHEANLNGLYLSGKQESFADGINWHSWKGYHESLDWTEIKIRPHNFRLPQVRVNDTT